MKKKITVGTLVRYLPEVVESARIDDPGLALIIELKEHNPQAFISSNHDILAIWLTIEDNRLTEECSSTMEIVSG